MVASNLRKLSTEYVVSEDRIRIIGKSQGSEPVVIWMTNRLASRAVPAIWRWLEKEVSPSAASTPLEGTVVQSFAQEAAVADLKPQKPVTAKTGAPTWVAQAVDISATKSHIRLNLLRATGSVCQCPLWCEGTPTMAIDPASRLVKC